MHSFQQERRHGLVLEAARDRERFRDGGEIVPVLIERGANGVDVAKRRKELERAGKQAFTSKQLQQPPRARSEEALAHRWLHDRTGVDQQLCARRAGEVLFADRVEAVAIGARGEFQQAAGAAPVVALPGQQRRIFSQQLLQAFDVVFVNEASSLRYRPLESLAEPFADLSREVLPAGVAVLARDHELRVALRQGQVNVWQLHPRTCDGISVTGGDVARELLCLFTEGFERRTSREGTSKWSLRPPFINRLCPAETRLKEGANAHDSDQNRWECSLAAGWWRPVSALPPVSRDCRFDVKRAISQFLIVSFAATRSASADSPSSCAH